MTATHLRSGELDGARIGEHWVLVLGGVTREGNRRARRAATDALESDHDVVWFDGFEERHAETGERVPLDSVPNDARLIVVGIQEIEENLVAGRLRTSKTLQTNAATRWIWRYFLRRLGSILRPRACWRAIRSDVETLSHRMTAPAAIVYCDDFSITSAWYAARIWPNTRVSTTIRLKDL